MKPDDHSDVVPFDTFWRWLNLHHNCIVRASSVDCSIYDQDDLHWHLYEEPGDRRGVQLMRGKQILAEMVIATEVVYVEVVTSPELDGHFEFHLLGGAEEMQPLYHFVLGHGLEEDDDDDAHAPTH